MSDTRLKKAEELLVAATDNLDHGQTNEALTNVSAAVFQLLSVLKEIDSRPPPGPPLDLMRFR